MRASDLFVQCLEAEGIEYIFGVPGEENADFMLALEESSKIRIVLTRHEQGAAFMAEAYRRLTGNPAGCLGTLGPGATNLLTGVADANMDRAPMLVITGQGSTRRLHEESHHIMDVVGMFKPVTKWATTILDADTIPEIIDSAIEMIRSADRPIIIAGSGCIRRRASDQLRRFCEVTGIGVLTTFMAKGAVDVDAEYDLYTIGLGTKDRANYAIDDADLIITLGLDMVEYHPSLWNPSGAKAIIHVDFISAEIDEHYLPRVEVVGDLAHTLAEFSARLLQGEALPRFDLVGQRATREALTQEFKEHADDTFGNPDWEGLAASFGWHGEYVNAAADLAPALGRALDHRGPSLLVVPVDYRENMMLTRRLGGLACNA